MTRAVNVWFAAHDHADCLVAYLDDLARARDISAIATDEALASHQTAPAMGVEIRYALWPGVMPAAPQLSPSPSAGRHPAGPRAVMISTTPLDRL